MPLTTLAIPLSALQEIGISENCKVNYQLTPELKELFGSLNIKKSLK